MYQSASLKRCTQNYISDKSTLPSVFCWSKMGAEAGQSLADIIRRKELERLAGKGVFAWGIGNSVGPAINYAKSVERVDELEALFTPMKSAAKVIDAAPSSVLLWLGYHAPEGRVECLSDHMLVTSRGHLSAGEEKKGHYALICRSETSLASQSEGVSIDHQAVRNLVSANPVGASQVTSVVRYRHAESALGSYPVLFRAALTGPYFVRLALPVVLRGALYKLYRETCNSSDKQEWSSRVHELRAAASQKIRRTVQNALF